MSQKEPSLLTPRNSYTVTVNKGTGISATSGGGSKKYGSTVTVGYTLSAGYDFNNWTGDMTTATFTMPASDVTMTANGRLRETAVTLQLTSSPSYITKVVTYHTDGTVANTHNSPGTSTVMTAYAGGKIVFYHASSRYWGYSDINGNGRFHGAGECCRFTVPSTATGAATLHVGSSGSFDLFHYQSSNTDGWVKTYSCYPALGS